MRKKYPTEKEKYMVLPNHLILMDLMKHTKASSHLHIEHSRNVNTRIQITVSESYSDIAIGIIHVTDDKLQFSIVFFPSSGFDLESLPFDERAY